MTLLKQVLVPIWGDTLEGPGSRKDMQGPSRRFLA